MTTTDYNEQALNFLRNSGTKMSIKLADIQTPPRWATGVSGNKYTVTLSRDRGAYTFDFWGSVHDRENHKTPSKYDVLACLDVYEGSLDDFVSDFGYEDGKITDVIATYNAVIDQSLQLKQLFTTQQLRQLEEIN